MAIRNVTPDCGSPVKLSAACCSAYVVYAPIMMNSPWARLMTFINPKDSASPQRDQQQD